MTKHWDGFLSNCKYYSLHELCEPNLFWHSNTAIHAQVQQKNIYIPPEDVGPVEQSYLPESINLQLLRAEALKIQ